jgi:deoxyribose-phosphate aldolase
MKAPSGHEPLQITRKELARYIDHTLLKPDASLSDIERMCKEAKSYGFFAVCVNPFYVRAASDFLSGSKVKVASVIGFPLGSTPSEVKSLEARNALNDGASELDMVINVGALKDGRDDFVRNDIRAVVQEARKKNAVVKVILETCLLTDEEKRRGCRLADDAGADFVKTSTGFAATGATIADVKLMRSVVPARMGVKASGGIHTAQQALNMIAAGATRIGASGSVQIVTGLPE